MLAQLCKTYNPIGRIVALRHADSTGTKVKGRIDCSAFGRLKSCPSRYGRVYVKAIRGGSPVQVDERGERMAVQMVRSGSKLRATFLLHGEFVCPSS